MLNFRLFEFKASRHIAMEHFPNIQLANFLSITLWALVSLGLLALTFRCRQLLYTNVLAVLVSGASLAACYSLAAMDALLIVALLSSLLLFALAYCLIRLYFSPDRLPQSSWINTNKRAYNFPSEAILPQLLEQSICGAYIFDLTTKSHVFVNAQYSKISGYSLNDLNTLKEGSGLINIIHPEDATAVKKHIEGAIANSSEEHCDLHYRFRHKDGNWIHCLSRDVVVKDDNGTASFLVGTFVDVTQLHEEHTELEKLQIRYAATFEDAPVGIAHVSQQGKFLRANRTLKNLLGYSDSELANLTFADITHPDDLQKDFDLLNSLIEGAIPQYKVDQRYFNAQNQVIWIELTVAAVRQANGEVNYFISIMRDITQSRLIAHELKETNAAFKRFVNSSPFLLEQPIEAIGAMATRIENKIVQRKIEKELLFIDELASISKVSEELSTRLDNLLDLVRFNPNVMSIDFESLEEIIKLSRNEAEFNSSYPRCRVSCDKNVSLPVNKSAFVKLIVNLCINIEQMRQLPDAQLREVKINCYPEDWHQRVVVELHCSGFQLTPEFKQLMLRAYDYQDENQLDEVGLRFAIIRQIVRAHQGQLEVGCDTDDGFSLTIILPAGITLP
ncbi:PAS domain S-box protein [uncultured Umboniibacter sp.]|uniref:PAS domain S-box protein n=1 Tax=uncultured Umboniibacter sp. TaxID=1798917 RepID=UPI002637EA1F|nr:PAS domain S-box protein [uncultured Umboniibacter sp.]